MGPGFEHLWGSLLTAALVLFFMYRRFRRSFGRQLVSLNRMVLRMVILATLSFLIAPGAVRASDGALALTAGLVLGLGLGVFAAQRTRFERHQEQLYYVPHTYTGMVVSALFLGRLIYRFLAHQQLPPVGAAPQSPDAAFATLYQNPVTLGVFFLLIGYYLFYYGYVLWKSKHLKPEDIESPPAAG